MEFLQDYDALKCTECGQELGDDLHHFLSEQDAKLLDLSEHKCIFCDSC